MAKKSSVKMGDILKAKIKNGKQAITSSKEKIVFYADEKSTYTESIDRMDNHVYSVLQETNQSLVDVETAYDNRVVVGCRTDVFWRVMGYSAAPTRWLLQATQMSKVGYTTSGLVGPGTCLTLVDSVGIMTGLPPSSSYGWELDNLHGIKIYDEPCMGGILTTFVGSSIGTVSYGGDKLYLMTPILTGGIVGLSSGQIITTKNMTIFSGGSNTNTIVGVGIATVDLSGVNVGMGTDLSEINVVTLENSTIGFASAPQVDGTYVTFNVLQNPDELPEDYGLPNNPHPYVPQTVMMMNDAPGTGGNDDPAEHIGVGVTIEYNNNGDPNVSKQWNQFLEGLVDPDVLDLDVRVKKPKVGADKIWYRVGFTDAPVYLGSRAAIGQTVVVTNWALSTLWETLPTCSTEESALTNAISVMNTKETQLSNNTGYAADFNTFISIDNVVRKELKDIQMRIWGFRSIIGQAQTSIVGWNDQLAVIENPDYDSIING